MIAAHFREYWLFGLLFALVAPLQVGWAAPVHRRPADRTLLATGAAVNVAVAGVWIASRTTGLPLGPHPGEPEAAGLKDVLATWDELLLAVIVVVVLVRSPAAWLVPPARALAGVSAVAALLPGGH